MHRVVTTPIRASRHLAIWIVWQSTGVTLIRRGQPARADAAGAHDVRVPGPRRPCHNRSNADLRVPLPQRASVRGLPGDVRRPRSVCAECGEPVERVFRPVAVHFKGSGFYTTDYARPVTSSSMTAARTPRSRSRTRRSPTRATRSPPRPPRPARTTRPPTTDSTGGVAAGVLSSIAARWRPATHLSGSSAANTLPGSRANRDSRRARRSPSPSLPPCLPSRPFSSTRPSRRRSRTRPRRPRRTPSTPRSRPRASLRSRTTRSCGRSRCRAIEGGRRHQQGRCRRARQAHQRVRRGGDGAPPGGRARQGRGRSRQ